MELPVYCEGARAGRLRLAEAGEQRLVAEMAVGRDDRGLFRGFLICRRGEVPLGVLEPRGGELRLRRMLLRRELEQLGEPVEGQMRLSFAFREEGGWRPLEQPGDFFTRPPFQGRLEGGEGLLWRRAGEGKWLAVPYRADRPFPLTDLFCFARIRTISGRAYAVFAFDGRERPVLKPV